MILGKEKTAKAVGDRPDNQSFSMMQDSTMIDGFGDHFGNFADYLSGKIPIMTPGVQGDMLFNQQVITCHMIEQEHTILSDKVHAFNPDFEDTRFAKNLSRKR